MSELQIKSELNALVLEVVVTVGAQVDEGETVIVLEAMKMEQAVTAPRKGTVGAIPVEPGQMVSEGDPLMTLST